MEQVKQFAEEKECTPLLLDETGGFVRQPGVSLNPLQHISYYVYNIFNIIILTLQHIEYYNSNITYALYIIVYMHYN